MMTPATVMVHVMPGGSTASLLQLAGDVAARLKVRKVIGISALRPLQIYAGPDAYVPQDLFEQDWAAMEKELQASERRFRAAFEGIAQVEWRSAIVTGLVADYVAEQMRAADLLLASPSERGLLFDVSRYMDLPDLILKAGRPVLVAGPHVTKLDLKDVLVCWNNSREARRAVEDAMFLLKLAGKVTVVEVAEDEELPDARVRVADVVGWLKEHEVVANGSVERARDEDSVILSEVASRLGAGLVVAGAYGHHRLREWVLGGVTRDMLLQPAQCSFVSH